MAGSSARGRQLQIDTDPMFDRIQWRIERIGWIAMGLVILLALLGFFGGDGPLMSATERVGDAEVSYNRMVRFQGITHMELMAPASGGEARVTFNQGYISNMEVEKVSPEPDSVEASEDSLTYVFLVPEGAESAAIRFNLRPERIGVLSADVETESGTLSFWQFALP